MKRIRNLGLVAVAAMALSAGIGVASASASGFVANGDPFYASITGTATGEHAIGFAGTVTSCTGANFSGAFEEPSSSVEATVSDPTCNLGGGQTLKLNGCKFIYKPGAETSPGVFNGTVDVAPGGCGPMGPMKYLGGCSVSFYPSTGMAATFENKGSGSEGTVTVTVNATNFQYKVSPLACGTEKITNGTYKGSWTVSATRNGSKVGLQVQSKLPVAIGLGVEKAQLEATRYPVSIAGSAQSESPIWHILTSTMTCKSAQYTGAAAAATAALAVNVAYSGCSAFGGLPMAVSSNGCYYVLNFAGSEDLVCPEGKSMEFLVYSSVKNLEEGNPPACTVKFAGQSGLTSVGFNVSMFQAVSVAPKLSNISFTQTRNWFFCPAGTSGTNGSYTDNTTLYGSR